MLVRRIHLHGSFLSVACILSGHYQSFEIYQRRANYGTLGDDDGPDPPPPCDGCPPGGIVVPGPFVLPPIDPPCFGSHCRPCQAGACPDGTSDGEGEDDPDDQCESDLSTQTGMCSNGNFPLYDPVSNQISCDVPEDEVPFYMSGCQEDADDNLEYSIDEIECEDENCPAASKRSLDERFVFADNVTYVVKRQQPPTKRPRTCPPTPPQNPIPGQLMPGRQGCDVVFECNTDLWPNVCNNAASAQANNGALPRAKPTALTYMGPGARQDYVTQQWWRTHSKKGNVQEHVRAVNLQRDAGNLPGQPHGGWGLIGCEVEEYPFGNSITNIPQNMRGIWDNRAVLRLIPWEENRDHGNALARFIAAAIRGDANRGIPAQSANGGWSYCVDITGGQLDTTDYLLGSDQSKNRCGQAYGPGYLLVNDISAGEARQYPNERKWDEWFDREDQLFEHTVYSSGQAIHTMDLPSQYGKLPAPGMKTFIRDGSGNMNAGRWDTVGANGVMVGTAAAAGVPGRTGQNLKYDSPGVTHAGILRRSIDIEDLGYDPRYMVASETPKITPAPTSRTDQASQATVTTTQLQTPAPAGPMARRPMEKVREKVLPRESRPKLEAGLKYGGSKTSNLFSRAERFRKRQSSVGGSFLDPRVYQQAFMCERPYEDPCEVQDCFEGGVVYTADGDVASDGSADQAGNQGEGQLQAELFPVVESFTNLLDLDTGDNGDNGGPPPSSTTPTPTSCNVPDGCQNVASPTGCAILCDGPTTTSLTPVLPTSTDIYDQPVFCWDPKVYPDRLITTFDEYVTVTSEWNRIIISGMPTNKLQPTSATPTTSSRQTTTTASLKL